MKNTTTTSIPVRILVSSKVLAKALSGINFETETVDMAEFVNGGRTSKALVIYGSKGGTAQITNVECDAKWQTFDHRGVRWDCVYDLMKRVTEQPVVLELYYTRVNVIFNY